jgi:phage tail-like protein
MRRAEIERLLPAVFQRTVRDGEILAALLDVMETLHAPSEEALAHVERFFDPRRAPDAFVPTLARWVDLDRILINEGVSGGDPLPSGVGRLRELIATAAELARWQGTRRGLLLFLETATGEPGFAIDEVVPDSDGRPRPFFLKIRCPTAATPYRDLIDRIVSQEKPAYVSYALDFSE